TTLFRAAVDRRYRALAHRARRHRDRGGGSRRGPAVRHWRAAPGIRNVRGRAPRPRARRAHRRRRGRAVGARCDYQPSWRSVPIPLCLSQAISRASARSTASASSSRYSIERRRSTVRKPARPTMCVATGIVTSWKEMMIARVVTVAQVGNWMAIATAMRISPSTCGFALACIRDSRSPKRARPTAAASDRSAPRKKSTAEMMSRTIVLPFLVRGRRPPVLGVVGPRIGPGAQPLTGGIGVRIERRLLALGDLIDRGDGRGGGSGLGGALLPRFL